MKHTIAAYLYDNANDDTIIAYHVCTALSLEREAYTPFDTATVCFPAGDVLPGHRSRIELYLDGSSFFLGLIDTIQPYTQGGQTFLKVTAKSFTSLLTQNELSSGLHSNLTLQSLLEDYYHFPNISCEENSQTGYIYVKAGSTMWDSIVSFCYKITGHYPYVRKNHICISAPVPADAVQISCQPETVLAYGTLQDTTKLVSHYHMKDLLGTENAYQQENPAAIAAQVVRHKYIEFDNAFRHAPQMALQFRMLYSCRGYRAAYVVLPDFRNVQIGDSVSCGTLLSQETACRVHITFGAGGFRTKIWCYRDGFYH